MSKQSIKAWVVLDPKERIIPWIGATMRRADAIYKACEGCMGAIDYHRLETDEKRWSKLKAEGYRVVRATVSCEA